jgi:hypothetical protein
MELGLCERFPAYTPIKIRKEKANEVLLLVERLNKNTIQKNKPKRRPAGDNWF